jgi:hypothetical protein
MVTDIIKNNGQAAGAVGFNTLSGSSVSSKPSVVLALAIVSLRFPYITTPVPAAASTSV